MPNPCELITKRSLLPIALFAMVAIAGCAKKHQQVAITAPPTIGEASSNDSEANSVGKISVPKNAKPIYVETGLASWYGPPYNKRNAADGRPFDMYQMTAAHKTLPLNSIVRVTNLKTGKAVVLRINDRGPFVGDRIIDLSLAAAKEIDVWRAGVARVKVEVLEAPKPLSSGGRWAVQIGAFSAHSEASKLKSSLSRKYKTANVIQFTGPTGDWVRLRPQDDDRQQAQQIARATQVNEGGVFLVRLD
jgi:peptidoglycan lytic transglycosylase